MLTDSSDVIFWVVFSVLLLLGAAIVLDGQSLFLS